LDAADAGLQLSARHQHAPSARLAADPDVGAEAHDGPGNAAAGVWLAEHEVIVETDVQNGSAA
jgi:hypothetical protein